MQLNFVQLIYIGLELRELIEVAVVGRRSSVVGAAAAAAAAAALNVSLFKKNNYC